MASTHPPPSRTTLKADPGLILRLECPQCHSRKALVVATHYGGMMRFCPSCEHAWDCPDALST